jgi:hypothetical protein
MICIDPADAPAAVGAAGGAEALPPPVAEQATTSTDASARTAGLMSNLRCCVAEAHTLAVVDDDLMTPR